MNKELLESLHGAYCITEEEIQKLEDIESYFSYHNKNLNAAQYYFICNDLKEMIEHLREHYCGYTTRDISYLENL